MKTVNLSVTKRSVYEEVAKTTSYSGSKMDSDAGAYARIFTTDDDRQMLERFWREACSLATERLKPFLTSVSTQDDEASDLALENNYDVTLDLPSGYDTTLTSSVKNSLYSFFVLSIVGKWYTFTNKHEAGDHASAAALALDDVTSKLYYRMKPQRPNLSALKEC